MFMCSCAAAASPLPGGQSATDQPARPSRSNANRQDRTIEALFDDWRLSEYVGIFRDKGYAFASDLLEASEQDLEALTAKFKDVECKRLRRKLAEIAEERL
jgi:hypothetical protein